MSRICIPIAERRASFARRMSVSVRLGETLGIVGESGSGKSTLAMALPGCRFFALRWARIARFAVVTDFIPHDIAAQLAATRAVIERHLGATLQAVHLFGSALDGGLKPRSDIDLLVTVALRPDEAVRCSLTSDLLGASAPPGCSGGMRALEVTVVAHGDVVPWRHPARRELQFGEWLRGDLEAGIVEPPLVDHDLAILLTKARQHGVALVGPPADVLFEPVPARDRCAVGSRTGLAWRRVQHRARDRTHLVQRRDRRDRAEGRRRDVGAGAPAGRAPADRSRCASGLSRWGSGRGNPVGRTAGRIHRLRAADGRVDAVGVATGANDVRQ